MCKKARKRDVVQEKTGVRKITITVTAQTAYNLERLMCAGNVASVGRVVDKLVREKMVSMRNVDNYISADIKM